jgi:hypothetical protein
VLDALYGVNLREQEQRAPVDKRLVALNTRVAYSGNFSESFSAVSDGPKLSVDGNTLSAVEGEIDTIPSGGTIDFLTITKSTRPRPRSTSCSTRVTRPSFASPWCYLLLREQAAVAFNALTRPTHDYTKVQCAQP